MRSPERRVNVHGAVDRNPSGIRAFALMLVVGTGLLCAAAAFHPTLAADPAMQLHTIAMTPAWQAIHVTMLVGSAFVVAGLPSRLLAAPPGHRLVVGLVLAVILIGLAGNAMNVAFMASHGTADASLYAAGNPSVVGLYAERHLQPLMFARAGNGLVAVGCLALGVVEWRDPTRPRWIAWLAWLAGVGGALGVLLFDPASRGAVAAVGLFCGWALGSAVLAWLPNASRPSRVLLAG